MIHTSIARPFTDVIRARGKHLHATGAVHMAHIAPEMVLAVVQGAAAPYPCTIRAEEGQLTLACPCAQAAEGDGCKHLWAFLLAISASGALANLLRTSGELNRVVVTSESTSPEAQAHLASEPPPPAIRPPETPSWAHALERARWRMQYTHDTAQRERAEWPADRRLVYIIDAVASRTAPGIAVDIATEKRARDGTWGSAKHFAYPTAVWFAVPDEADQTIARALLGAAPLPDYGRVRTSFVLSPHANETVLRLICNTGRARLRTHASRTHLTTLRWDDGGADRTPWRFTLAVKRMRSGEHVLEGAVSRGEQRLALNVPDLLHPSGVIVVNDTVARFDDGDAFPVITELLSAPGMAVGRDVSVVLSRLYAMPSVPELTLPDDVSIAQSHEEPTPVLTFTADPTPIVRKDMAGMQLGFRYGPVYVGASDAGTTRYAAESNTLHHRHHDAEARARDRLMSLGASDVKDLTTRQSGLVVPRQRIPALAFQLAREGWQVEADGRAFRAPGTVRASVRSGVDWFDLDGAVEYGDLTASLSAVLEARRKGENLVELSDGSYGLLPVEWLNRLGPLLAGGTRGETGTRFRKTQLSLLDALLTTLPDVDVDEAFAKARAELAQFEHVAPADAPAGFAGVLREYQREGLGWLHFLRRFGFGGCLADDMGLGKTIQVLALLEARRAEGHGPSLVVVPRSLVFNWRREAEKFAPQMRVLDWSESERRVDLFDPSSVDLVLVTYGTLRRDAVHLGAIAFDYVVLDEAQAIKNSSTATAKATRLLQAQHRLALSGTPIENRIEELWSVLDFLNPGMLGGSLRFASMFRGPSDNADAEAVDARDDAPGDVMAEGEGETTAGSAADSTAESTSESAADSVALHEVLARALRPVILRRTKAAVAPELPERIETTLEVELEPKQREFYDSVRDRYRSSLFTMLDRDGLQKSRMHILEALLRLRQAACHPVLADARRSTLPSAKLDALLPALAEISAEGNKALVFSQFTEFLALVRTALDEQGIAYEYLDGRTRDRQARVDRFQNDPDCPLFLVSLKAGGHGLNLTAADYVFLLDPWWNPAVEAQAIDRAHRIGRTRRVIATRLVARDTIEEKILQLQASKRALADAILTADKGVMASIGREELELLLG